MVKKPMPVRLTWLAGVLGIVALIAAVLVSDGLTRQRAVLELGKQADISSEILSSTLERELEKYRLASLVLAQDADAMAILQGARGPRLMRFNMKLEGLSQQMGAAAIYLLDTRGTTLASSNWAIPETFVGQNYRFRSYFRAALSAGSHEQFALGTISRRPGLYLSRRLDREGVALGVIVSKVEFDALESEWKKAGIDAFVTNPDGVILVTSRADWRFKTVEKLTEEMQFKMLKDLDYGDRPLQVLPAYQEQIIAKVSDRKSQTKPLIESIVTLQNGWVLHVLRRTDTAIEPAVFAGRLGVFAVAMVVLTLITFWIYVRRSAAFVAERDLAQRQRLLQERLVQLNKLAALGQIAAGVGHEINQPLAAISSYAQNGLAFLARGNPKGVSDNLTRIGQLCERIGAITGELRGFARKATGTMSATSMKQVIDGALLLLRDRIKTAGARVIVSKKDAFVLAEAVRLEQVLVNLMQNALDARGQGLVLEIGVTITEAFVEIEVRDNGPGLSEAARLALFQPFSTTKRDGLGLGLVISRDIVADFGGELVALSPEAGASFLIRLRPAAAESV